MAEVRVVNLVRMCFLIEIKQNCFGFSFSSELGRQSRIEQLSFAHEHKIEGNTIPST